MYLAFIGRQEIASQLKAVADGALTVERMADHEAARRMLDAQPADALVLDIGAKDETGQVVEHAIATWPALPIIAVVRDDAAGSVALRAGAHEVVPAHLLAGVDLAAAVARARARLDFARAIEERHAVISEQYRSRIVARLANTVAHEVNNPLAVVSVNLSTLGTYLQEIQAALAQSAPLSDAAAAASLREVMDDIPALLRESSHAADRIKEVVLRLQRFMSHPESLDRGTLLNELIESVVAFTTGLHGAHCSIATRLRPVPEIDVNVTALSHVLFTLIDRATAGAQRQRDIRLSIETDSAPRVVQISIAAERGAPTAQGLAQLHQQLTAGALSLADDAELAVCRHLLASIGAHLTLVENEQQTALLLLITTRIDAPLPAAAPAPTVSSAPARPRVLVIDDESTLLSSYRRALRKDYEVTTAGDGLQALTIIGTTPPFDVVVCDLRMPVCDGVEFFERLKALQPELCPRIVFVAGELSSDRHLKFMQDSKARFLQKPVDVKILRETLAEIRAAVH